ncbi:MAG: transketolase family protein, partial [Candidatus Paceibacterota bacterium]
MSGVASGMAAMGYIPFMASYAMFSPGRNWEQIRTTIAYNNQPVKIVGAHAGISVGPDGATHQ